MHIYTNGQKIILQMNWNCEFAKQGIESKKLLGMHKCVVKKKWCVQVCNTKFQKLERRVRSYEGADREKTN